MTFVSPLSKKRNRENDWRLFLRLVPYARRRQRLLWVSAILLVPLAIAGAIQPILVGQAISLIRGEDVIFFLKEMTLSAGLNLLTGLLLAAMVVRSVLESVQGFAIQKVGQGITYDIRNDLFEKVTALPMQFFDRTPVGKLITRLTSDIDALGDVFSTGAIGILSDSVSIIALTIAMFTVQWQLALLLLGMLIPISFVVVYFQRQYRVANYRAREELSRLNAGLQENITGINVVQIFRRERFNARLFRQINEKFIKAIDATIFHDAAVSSTLEWISLVAIGGILWLGGLRVMQDSLSFGTLASFILFSQRLFNPLRQFAEKFTTLQAGFTAIERIAELMDEPIEIRDPRSPLSLKEKQQAQQGHAGEIRFENVWFAYKKDDDYAIRDLNFTIQPGEKIALVGPTGAGKSTVIRLLCRLYETTKGRILVDGIDVRDLAQGELRQHLGVILQDGFVFAGDVKSNITLGETYSLEKIQTAARETNVDRFIESLPQSYDTPLRERGTNLSGGQKQLLAFARCAIRDPKVMVLDEATASLDVGTEAFVQEALDRLLANRTAIIIAHRLSTIRNVDRIFVLQQGQLIEAGNHEELLRKDGLYASLYRLQMLGS